MSAEAGSGRPRVARPVSALFAVAGVVAVVVAVAFSDGGGGKGGVARQGPAIFGHFDQRADPDAFTPGGPAFLSTLRDISGGRIAPLATKLRDQGPQGLIESVRSGAIQGAWVQASDLEAAGYPSLAALSAPFTVTTYDDQRALVNADLAGRLLAEVDDGSLKPLALLPGSLRRPATAGRPLLGTDAWTGIRVWSASPSQSATLAALGAIPTDDPSDAKVTDLATLVAEDAAPVLPHVTSNVVLWPRWWVLVASRAWWDDLTSTEQGWVTVAAASAREAGLASAPPEARLASSLCLAGARFASASPSDLDSLHAAVEPVLTRLEEDPATEPLMSLIRTRIGGSAPAVDLTLPASCRGSAAPVGQAPDHPPTESSIPTGTYRSHLSEHDIAEAGSGKSEDAQVVTLILRPDGTFENTSQFDNDGSSMVFEAGRYYGDGQRIYFVNSLGTLRGIAETGRAACVWTEPELGCVTHTHTYSLSWRVGPGGEIQFADPEGMIPDPVTRLSMLANPFRPVR